MGVSSGIGGQFGFAPETTYGTPVASTHFLPVVKATPKLKLTYAQGAGMAAGQLLELASQRMPTLRQGEITMDLELQSNGFGLLLQALMGTSVTPVQQGSTAAYLQTHLLADPFGKFLSCQVGIPDTQGVVHPYTATGCKVAEADFSFDINATTPLMSTWTIDAQNVIETQALAAASYVASRPFVATDVTIKVGPVGSETSVDGVTKVDIKIPRPMKTTRFYHGNAGLKDEPILNSKTSTPSGTIQADYVDKTIWADRFASHSQFSLVAEAKGVLIASTYYQTLRITLPASFVEGDTPDLASADVINGAFPFVVKGDPANPVKIEYISTDVTL